MYWNNGRCQKLRSYEHARGGCPSSGSVLMYVTGLRISKTTFADLEIGAASTKPRARGKSAMRRKKKSRSGNFGPKTDFTGNEMNLFSASKYTGIVPSNQCIDSGLAICGLRTPDYANGACSSRNTSSLNVRVLQERSNRGGRDES